jgi:hypothetical protein
VSGTKIAPYQYVEKAGCFSNILRICSRFLQNAAQMQHQGRMLKNRFRDFQQSGMDDNHGGSKYMTCRDPD